MVLVMLLLMVLVVGVGGVVVDGVGGDVVFKVWVLTSMVQKSHISTLFNMAQLAYTQNLKV